MGQYITKKIKRNGAKDKKKEYNDVMGDETCHRSRQIQAVQSEAG